MKTLNIYLAGPIFTERDRMYLDYLYNKMEEMAKTLPLLTLNIYAPQRNASINDKTKSATAADVYHGDYERLRNTDVLMAVVSGDTPPIGTTCEIGIFSEMMHHHPEKQLFALLDDMREMSVTHSAEKDAAGAADAGENQYSYCNIFLTGCIKENGLLYTKSDTMLKDFYNYCLSLVNQEMK